MSTIPIQSDDRPTGDALSLPAVNGGASRARKVNAANVILKFATAGNAGTDARGGGKNLGGHESLTPVEARTDAEKFIEAACLERAA